MTPARRYRAVMLLGIMLRLGFVLAAGNGAWPRWSAGGDVQAYVTVAGNVVAGQGYTYSGEPTALRPPLYTFLVAACMGVAGRLWPLVLRLVQFLLGLATVFLGARAAKRLWGSPAGPAAALLLLYCPTLVYPTSTVSPEALAAFLVAAVFYCAVENLENDWQPALGGVAIGLATLAKEVVPVLGVPFVVLYLRRGSLRALGMIVLASAVVVSPWALRNYLALGTPTLSTLGGYGLVDALTNPQGRAQAGEASQTRAVLGWGLGDYERNGRSVPYPPEAQMDAAAKRTWLRIVRARPGWPLETLPVKLSWFWLSTDILFYSRWYSPAVRLTRAAMAAVWWGYLLLALLALPRLRGRGENRAFWLFVGWFALVTLVHVPFAMSTRLRIPLADVPVTLLAGEWLARSVVARRFIFKDI